MRQLANKQVIKTFITKKALLYNYIQNKLNVLILKTIISDLCHFGMILLNILSSFKLEISF